MKDHFLENWTKVGRAKLWTYFFFRKYVVCLYLWLQISVEGQPPARVLSSTSQLLVYISIRACRVPTDPFVHFNGRWVNVVEYCRPPRYVMWIELRVVERCGADAYSATALRAASYLSQYLLIYWTFSNVDVRTHVLFKFYFRKWFIRPILFSYSSCHKIQNKIHWWSGGRL